MCVCVSMCACVEVRGQTVVCSVLIPCGLRGLNANRSLGLATGIFTPRLDFSFQMPLA